MRASARSVALPAAMPRPTRRVRCLLRGEDGGAVVEMGLIIALFAAPLLVGTGEAAQIVYYATEIQEAANAGAMCGMTSTTLAASTSAITSAAQADAPDFGANLSVTPTTYWVCPTAVTGTHYTSLSSATSACSDTPLEFLQVKTSDAITLPIHYAKLGASYTLQAISVQEVEQ